MKRLILLFFIFLSFDIYANPFNYQGNNAFEPNIQVQKNTYGPNTYIDQYGRPFSMPSDTKIKKQHGYGNGNHVDQYGRPFTFNPKR